MLVGLLKTLISHRAKRKFEARLFVTLNISWLATYTAIVRNRPRPAHRPRVDVAIPRRRRALINTPTPNGRFSLPLPVTPFLDILNTP